MSGFQHINERSSQERKFSSTTWKNSPLWVKSMWQLASEKEPIYHIVLMFQCKWGWPIWICSVQICWITMNCLVVNRSMSLQNNQSLNLLINICGRDPLKKKSWNWECAMGPMFSWLMVSCCQKVKAQNFANMQSMVLFFNKPGDEQFDFSTLLLDFYRRFHSSITSDQKWLRERSHESYAKNYSMVFPHDEPLAGRNMRHDPFHKVQKQLLSFYCFEKWKFLFNAHIMLIDLTL